MKQKALLYGLSFVVAALILYSINKTSQLNREREIRIELQKTLEDQKKSEIEALKKKNDSLVLALWDQITKVTSEAQTLNNKLKRYEKSPDLDIDFISAFDVITKSDYQSKE
jgi:hypothetical protein